MNAEYLLLICLAQLLFKDGAKISIRLSHQIRGIQLTRLDCNSGQWRKKPHYRKRAVLTVEENNPPEWFRLEKAGPFSYRTAETFIFCWCFGVFSHFWRWSFCWILQKKKKKKKCCLFTAIFLLWTNVIRFSTNEVPLRRIKCQWFCTALLNLNCWIIQHFGRMKKTIWIIYVSTEVVPTLVQMGYPLSQGRPDHP